MFDWLESLVLGAVQGLTEFLPISSDGHLVVTQQAFGWLRGRERSGAEDLFFDVMLHLGTLTAILIHYRAVARTGARGLLGSDAVAPEYRRNAIVHVGILAVIATLPLLPLAVFFLKYIKQAFDSPAAAGVGFLITAVVLLLTPWLQNKGEGGRGALQTTWRDALLIGLAQMFAPLPGVSRSGLTVATALSLGLSRTWAVGFSLLIAIPAILGAAAKELKDVDPSTLTSDRVAQTIAATIVAGVVGYAAIIWLVKIVRSGRMWYFSVYLVVLGLAVLLVSTTAAKGDRDGRRQDAAERTIGGAVARRVAGRAGGPVAGADAAGAGAVARGGRASEAATRGRLVLVRPLGGGA